MQKRTLVKDMTISKPPGEGEILALLKKGEVLLSPVSLHLLESGNSSEHALKPDGIVEASWQGAVLRYVFEYKGQNTPKVIDVAISQAMRYSQNMGMLPLVIVPYLSEEQLRLLEAQQVSGFDLCGNGVLMGPGLLLWRSGSPNRYKNSQPIKNIYRGMSSVFARCFLLRSEFSSLTELREFALSRLMAEASQSGSDSVQLVKSTASKVVQALEEERFLVKEKGNLRLTDPEGLLRKLKENFSQVKSDRLEGKTALSIDEIWQRLQATSSRPIRAVATGTSSATRYGVLSSPEKTSLYVSDLKAAEELLEVRTTRAFPNIEIVEAQDDLVYFDARRNGEALWASPIQTWLELSAGGPRERQAALSLETALLKGRAKELL